MNSNGISRSERKTFTVVQSEHLPDSGDGTSGIIGASFNLVNSIIGAGIVALPFAVKECGMVMGITLLVVLAFMIDFSVIVLVECGIKTGKKNLEELSLSLFGVGGYNIAAIIMFCYSYGSIIACMVVIGDTVPSSLRHLTGMNSTFFNRELLMTIAGVVIILPLCLLRNISSLSSASFVSLSAVLLLVIIVAVAGPSEAADQGLEFDPSDVTFMSPSIFGRIGTISFHYVCQHSTFLVFRSLKSPTLTCWTAVSHLSIAFTLVMSLLIAIAGYVCFVDTTMGNVLNNFSETSTVITVARLFMALNMIFTVPMECFVVRHAIFSLLNRYCPLPSQKPQPILANNTNSEMSSSQLFVRSPMQEYVEESDSEFGGMDDEVDSSWGSITPRDLQGTLLPPPDNDEATWDSTAHVLTTVVIWTSTMGFSLVFADVAVVLEFSGILTASVLGYILPAAIFLKSHETELRIILFSAAPCKQELDKATIESIVQQKQALLW
eukprot:CAMPEP_0185027530 /NCGR_PEP_ID=MMETSP1103-20130426/12686_1 /TAXON_ID=36769 /ORGANISM="Paraphysomonas bandaiensis, Strain Caron Lab Isolate" /LENGTH=493 /DNA_ID=CAMNT_0027561579 /DNA_START=35 /DNA_END=1513 /DNA_ORIENTATION=-